MENNAVKQPAVPSALKYRNRELILNCFRDHQEHTVADIVTRTGISKLTVMRAIQFFCTKNILISSGKGESTEQGGKRPEYFRLGLKKYLLTIMLWPESLGLTLFNMDLQEVRRSSLSWIIPATPEQAFAFVRAQSMALLSQAGIGCSDLYGVSLSTSGIVDYDSLVLKYSVHSPEWGNDIPVGDFLKAIFGDIPCYFIENAGKSISRAILAEQDDPNRRILVLFTSWGLSGALIQDGKILSGRDSLIGEVGHMILNPADTELCSCGSYGCIERLVSIARLRKHIATNPPPATSPLSKLAPEAVTWNHLFFASQQGDPYARTYGAFLADCFSALIRNVALVFNPEAVVFVGDFAIADDYFNHRMQEKFRQFHYLATSMPLEVHYDTRLLSELDARGGACAMLDHFFTDPSIFEDLQRTEDNP